MLLTTSDFLYKLSIESEHTAMVCYVPTKLCSSCLRVATINDLGQKPIACRFLQLCVSYFDEARGTTCVTYINRICRRTLSSTAIAIGN